MGVVECSMGGWLWSFLLGLGVFFPALPMIPDVSCFFVAVLSKDVCLV